MLWLSPRMRGCFLDQNFSNTLLKAFPAYAGMFPITVPTTASQKSFPRVCGDVSIQASDERTSNEAFPAYAGMFLGRLRKATLPLSFPRVCGDVSDRYSGKQLYHQLSPRMRGCFRKSDWHYPDGDAFPAYAGMFLVCGLVKVVLTCFPRVCGDVSKEIYAQGTADELSPRMRGCFRNHRLFLAFVRAFPAYAGMFLPSALTPSAG